MPINLTIEQLPQSDAEKVAAAKTAVEAALEKITATNSMTESEIETAVNNALTGTGVTAKLEGWNKTDATPDGSGSITGTVKLECGNETASVPINLTIEQLPQSDA